jgi:hypothetical protein
VAIDDADAHSSCPSLPHPSPLAVPPSQAHFEEASAPTTRAALVDAMRADAAIAPLLGLQCVGDGTQVDDVFSGVTVNKALEIMKRAGGDGDGAAPLTKDEAASFLTFDASSRAVIARSTAAHSVTAEAHAATIDEMEPDAILEGFSFVDDAPLSAAKAGGAMVLTRAQKTRCKELFDLIDVDHDTLISIKVRCSFLLFAFPFPFSSFADLLLFSPPPPGARGVYSG